MIKEFVIEYNYYEEIGGRYSSDELDYLSGISCHVQQVTFFYPTLAKSSLFLLKLFNSTIICI